MADGMTAEDWAQLYGHPVADRGIYRAMLAHPDPSEAAAPVRIAAAKPRRALPAPAAAPEIDRPPSAEGRAPDDAGGGPADALPADRPGRVKRGRHPVAAVAARREKVAALAAQGLRRSEIADRLGIGGDAVGNDLKALRKAGDPRVPPPLPPSEQARGRPRPVSAASPVRGPAADGPATESVDARKARRADAGAAEVKAIRDRRRFTRGPVATGVPARLEPAEAEGTRYASRVFGPVEAEHVLIDGANNAKIGGDVLVGRLKGARIFTLTLEERATCPRSCGHWRSCYGNSMPWARRWRHGPALERAIRLELLDLCATHDRVLIRLHVLGDFYSVDYVEFWEERLRAHPNLSAFGFTAHPEGSEIGAAVARVRKAWPGRFMIRHSGRGGPMGSYTINFPTEAPQLGCAVVCPEQRDANLGSPRGVHCGSCAVCWQTDRAIVFVVH